MKNNQNVKELLESWGIRNCDDKGNDKSLQEILSEVADVWNKEKDEDDLKIKIKCEIDNLDEVENRIKKLEDMLSNLKVRLVIQENGNKDINGEEVVSDFPTAEESYHIAKSKNIEIEDYHIERIKDTIINQRKCGYTEATIEFDFEIGHNDHLLLNEEYMQKILKMLGDLKYQCTFTTIDPIDTYNGIKKADKIVRLKISWNLDKFNYPYGLIK